MKEKGLSTVGGWALLEISIAMSLLGLAVVGMASVIMSAGALAMLNRETALAMQAGRGFTEQMQSAFAFEELFAAYNENPLDDPGTSLAPGSEFQILGQSLGHGSTSYRLTADGVIRFPENSLGQLREDILMPELGMPQDLNGDGVIDNQDHSLDYRLLPVSISLTWRSKHGQRTMTFRTILTRH